VSIAGGATVLANPLLNVDDNAGATMAGLMVETGGSINLLVTGLGTLSLPNINSFSGGLTMNMGGSSLGGTVTSVGTVTTSNAGSLGTGTLTIDNGAFVAGAALPVVNSVVLNAGTGALVGLGSNTITISGPITENGNTTSINGNVVVASTAPISGSG